MIERISYRIRSEVLSQCRFEDRSYVTKFRTFSNSSGSTVKNKLETIKLICRKVKKQRVAVVQFRVNESSSNIASSILIQDRSETPQISHMKKTRFSNR